jgi:hypothetical protein
MDHYEATYDGADRLVNGFCNTGTAGTFSALRAESC